MPEDTPRKYKQRWYSAVLTFRKPEGQNVVPVGASAEASFNIVNLPFTATKITSTIVGPSHLYELPDPPLPDDRLPLQAFDGQYTLEIRSDQHNYQSEPMIASAMHGLAAGGFLPLAAPMPFAPKTAVTLRAVNKVPRVEDTSIQVVFSGVEPVVDDPGIPS